MVMTVPLIFFKQLDMKALTSCIINKMKPNF